jgi:hypothetical protein
VKPGIVSDQVMIDRGFVIIATAKTWKLWARKKRQWLLSVRCSDKAMKKRVFEIGSRQGQRTDKQLVGNCPEVPKGKEGKSTSS